MRKNTTTDYVRIGNFLAKQPSAPIYYFNTLNKKWQKTINLFHSNNFLFHKDKAELGYYYFTEKRPHRKISQINRY